MAIRSYKPTSPGRRFVTTSDFKELTKSRPEKKLTKGKKRSSGRNAEGHITSRHRGRGHKRRYRIIDFKRNKYDVPARVATIEYDPNRSANIALLSRMGGTITTATGLGAVGSGVLRNATNVTSPASGGKKFGPVTIFFLSSV